MSKSISIKIITMIIVLSLSISYVTVISAEQLPRNIAIIRTYNNLTLGTLSKLTCGQTEVQGEYSAGLVMELQKYDNEWTTIKIWSGTDIDYIRLYQDRFVEKGTYRLQLTHKAYNSEMKQVESLVKYSKTIFYE